MAYSKKYSPPDKKNRPNRVRRHVSFDGRQKTRTEDELFELLKASTRPPFLLILDGLTDPHNFGACLRTAETAGVHAVIITKDRSVPVTRVVQEVASGAAERVPIVEVTNLARCMKKLKEQNIWIVGTSHRAEKSLYDIDFRGAIAIVVGSEGDGMRRLTEEECDFTCRIPMHGSIECLNVSVATGVCLFEAVRQRLKG